MAASTDRTLPSWLTLGLGTTGTFFGGIAGLTSAVVYGVKRSKIRLSPDAASLAFRALAYSTVIVSVSGAATVAFIARSLDVKSIHEFRLRVESMMPRSEALREAFLSYNGDHVESISSWLVPVRSTISSYLTSTSFMTSVRAKYQTDAYKMTELDHELMEKVKSLEHLQK